MHILQQGLESEHKSAIENMKGKMVKLRQDYKNKTESLKTQYSSELSELRRQVNQYHEHQRAKTNTPTQVCNTPITWSKNYPDYDLDSDLDRVTLSRVNTQSGW